MLTDIFRASKQRHTRYLQLCIDTNSVTLGPYFDVPTRWNSTWFMPDNGLRQRPTLELFHDNLAKKRKVRAFSVRGWEMISKLSELLKSFKTATTYLSGVYYPTSPLVLHQIWLVCVKINEFEYVDPMYDYMIVPMKSKLRKYFEELPAVFTCAAALNPTLTITGVETLIEKIVWALELHLDDPNCASKQVRKSNTYLENMFEHYSLKYDSTTSVRQSMGFGESSSSSSNPNISLFNDIRNDKLKRARGSAPNSELNRYGATDFMFTANDFENFDILGWWKQMEPQFPVLAAMAHHLDAADRIQDTSNLEGELVVEEKLHEEVAIGAAKPLTEEEQMYDDSVRSSSPEPDLEDPVFNVDDDNEDE
ncbi:zinc finger BED domain-containing protein RICESLEEPER 2-like [Bidens hawaiensis]|uniref:zinc finger BED domain-containing protein RICESLEEPER 2-like n=1 Tax=Bidens hawaiensis TaxID=980011 RepID=UPI00404A2072